MLLVLLILLGLSLFQAEVVFHPGEELYIPINTEWNITCSFPEGQITKWSIVFQNYTEVTLTAMRKASHSGITGVRLGTTLLIVINTNNTSITGLKCEGFEEEKNGVIVRSGTNSFNLTVYGIQIPPMIQTVRVINNLLYTSWNYVRIPTVDVTLHWSLSFFRPSQLSNMTTTLLNTNTYNNTLQGARSCDPFRLCIKAENVVGNSSWSCVNNTLPFLPSVENIHYALSRFNDYFTLTVTILVLSDCESFNGSTLTLVVKTRHHNGTTITTPMYSDNVSMFVVDHLELNSFYSFSIRSRNAIGERLTGAVNFSTSGIQGFTVCSRPEEDLYILNCNYTSGSFALNGCIYELVSRNKVIHGTLAANESGKINFEDINADGILNVTVTNFNGNVIVMTYLDFSTITICATTADHPLLKRSPSIPIAIVAAIIVGGSVAVVVLFVVFGLLCLICHRKIKKRIHFQDTNHKSDSGPNEDAIYSTVTTVNLKQRDSYQKAVVINELYSKINNDPIYFVLENGKGTSDAEDKMFPLTFKHTPSNGKERNGESTLIDFVECGKQNDRGSSATPDAIYEEIKSIPQQSL